MITTPLLSILRARVKQKYRTMPYPKGDPPNLPDRYMGKPVLDPNPCPEDCSSCISSCPVEALFFQESGLHLDMGSCLFCGACADVCPSGAIRFSKDYRLAAKERNRLVIESAQSSNEGLPAPPLATAISKKFHRSLRLRQVSAGGCNACEADCNVLNTLAWDMGRFGIQFVASPRHADGILVTGPVTENMKVALEKTYRAVPAPKVVIAVGSCAISGGPYKDHPEQGNGVSSILPVDLFIPGCPPHPLTILEGLLRFVGRI